MSKPEYRKAERDAFCRVCDKTIHKGEHAVFWYSWRNRGQNIMVCPDCVENLFDLLPKENSEGRYESN